MNSVRPIFLAVLAASIAYAQADHEQDLFQSDSPMNQRDSHESRQPRLVWSDEFDQFDQHIWQPMIGDGTEHGIPGWGNEELQYYTGRPENVRVENGELIITALKEDYEGFQYTSARLRTQGRIETTYGRIEARIRVPATRGIWPAFWMLPTNDTYGSWPLSGELDIIETTNDAMEAHGTIHFGHLIPENAAIGGKLQRDVSFGADYAVYAVDWYPDRIEWSVDGKLYHRVFASQWFTGGSPESLTAPFDQPFHFLLNVAVGGRWPGNPDSTSEFPQEMRVDWVRLYEMPERRAPYLGTPFVLPGVIEAEHYDLGGQGVAYAELEPKNLGAAFRPHEAVDLESSSEGGTHVGWIAPGEWLSYSIDAQHHGERGRYRVTARVSSASELGGNMLIGAEGNSSHSFIHIPPTGSWQAWTTVTSELELNAGPGVIKLTNAGGNGTGFNIDRFRFELLDQADSSTIQHEHAQERRRGDEE